MGGDKKRDPVVVRLTADEVLNSVHNEFLDKYVRTIIDIEMYSKMGPHETAYTQSLIQGQGPKGQIPQSAKVKITAKEAIEDLRPQKVRQKNILDAIEALRGSKELKGL